MQTPGSETAIDRKRLGTLLPKWFKRKCSAALALDIAYVRLDNAVKQTNLLARQNAPLPRQRFRGVVLSQLAVTATCWAP